MGKLLRCAGVYILYTHTLFKVHGYYIPILCRSAYQYVHNRFIFYGYYASSLLKLRRDKQVK